jgi:hypothetical protein
LERKSEETGRVATGTGNQDAGRFAEIHFSLCWPGGKSFGNTAVLLRVNGSRHLTRKAIYIWTGKSGEWLRRPGKNRCRESRMPAKKPVMF